METLNLKASQLRRKIMPLLLWLLGVPLTVVLLLLFFGIV